jgi:hypothetical protein
MYQWGVFVNSFPVRRNPSGRRQRQRQQENSHTRKIPEPVPCGTVYRHIVNSLRVKKLKSIRLIDGGWTSVQIIIWDYGAAQNTENYGPLDDGQGNYAWPV